MDDILGKKANSTPPATVSNNGGLVLREDKEVKPAEKKSSPRDRRAAEKKALFNIREEKKDNRHKEKMQAIAEATKSIDKMGQTHTEMKDIMREMLDRMKSD
jgi:hypothetical protein